MYVSIGQGFLGNLTDLCIYIIKILLNMATVRVWVLKSELGQSHCPVWSIFEGKGEAEEPYANSS